MGRRYCVFLPDACVADGPPSRASPLPQWICGLPGIAGVARNPVGVGLLTEAVGRAIFLWLTHRFREQARSDEGLRAQRLRLADRLGEHSHLFILLSGERQPAFHFGI